MFIPQISNQHEMYILLCLHVNSVLVHCRGDKICRSKSGSSLHRSICFTSGFFEYDCNLIFCFPVLIQKPDGQLCYNEVILYFWAVDPFSDSNK